VTLVCEESATYRQGTDTRSETQAVYHNEIFRRDGFTTESGVAFEAGV